MRRAAVRLSTEVIRGVGWTSSSSRRKRTTLMTPQPMPKAFRSRGRSETTFPDWPLMTA